MATEIVAFILNISGWILVCSTLPTDYWKVSSVDGTVITTATFWSNLWKTCVTDSTGVSNCKDFPSMLALDVCLFISLSLTPTHTHPHTSTHTHPVYIQVCRGLMIASVCLGFFGATLALMGMKCTRIGGSESTKARLTGLSGLHFILNGLCSLTACSLYAHRITSEFFDPLFFAQKFELGAALFIGWAGSVLCISGGLIFCLSLSEGFSRAECSYSGGTSMVTKRHKPGKSANSFYKSPVSTDPRDPAEHSRQFGKNAYV
ncbi:claudin-10-like [Oncorhynchus mykiss]|uniref:claudin-10-like n=1 Tax=Oncorhynchus mykiss TaxID=8022 RepID=UPI001877C593|nr:claudin-10-like [Oncorhynchus mykiss]